VLKGRPDDCGVTTAFVHGVDLWSTLFSISASVLVGVNLLSRGLDDPPDEQVQDASCQDLTQGALISCAHSATRLVETSHHVTSFRFAQVCL
jgi:hypothetical protein